MYDAEGLATGRQYDLTGLRCEIDLRLKLARSSIPDTNCTIVVGNGKMLACRIHCYQCRRASDYEFGDNSAAI